jgi:chromosomal replication initiation ATPase DnaA
MPGPAQLPLALPHAPSFGREDFVRGASNSAALRLIESWPGWTAPLVLLSGPAGSGKSPLVHIWAAQAGARVVPANSMASHHEAADLGAAAALAVEDVPADAVPEAPLFHLINRIREVGGSLLLTSRGRGDDWRIGLPDLRSRIRLAIPATLGAPDDELLRKVLVKLFSDRQLVVDRPLIDYLISRMERSLSAAVRLVNALDEKALAAGRPITRAVASEVLSGEEEFADRQ